MADTKVAVKLVAACAAKVRFNDEASAIICARKYGKAYFYCSFCFGYHLAQVKNEYIQKVKAKMMLRDASNWRHRDTAKDKWEPPTDKEIERLAAQGKCITVLDEQQLAEVINYGSKKRRPVDLSGARSLACKKWLHTHKGRYELSPFASRIISYWMNGLTANQVKALLAARHEKCHKSWQGTKRLIKLGMLTRDGKSITPEGENILLGVHTSIQKVLIAQDQKADQK